MTVIVGQEAGGGAGRCVVPASEIVDRRGEEDTVMPQQLLPPKRGERVREVARRWPGPTIQLAEL